PPPAGKTQRPAVMIFAQTAQQAPKPARPSRARELPFRRTSVTEDRFPKKCFMSLTPLLRPASIAILLSAAAMTAGPAAQARPPLGIDTARVTIAGTSNIHEYTASTTTVRVTRVAIGSTIPAPT